jgi:hypothetical protein
MQKIIRNNLIMFFFTQLSFLTLYAQSTIKGSVIKEDNGKLANASVKLLHQDSTFIGSCITNINGDYEFKGLKTGKYIIGVSSIGYVFTSFPITVSKADENIKLPTVKLKTDNIFLSGIEVNGNHYMRSGDHILIIPNIEEVKHSMTGYDLLYNLMIPGIDVDKKNGKVSTFGGDVTLYIDGRKTDYREIRGLRPEDVLKIEYYDVPVGKYSNDIAAINYITKKSTTGGYVALDGSNTIGYDSGDYNLVSKKSKGNTSYTLFAGEKMLNYGGSRNVNNESFIFPDYDVERHTQTTDAEIRNNNEYAQLNILNQNDKHTLMVKITYICNSEPKNYKAAQMDYSGYYDTSRYSIDNSNKTGNKPAIDLYGSFNLKNNQYIEVGLHGNHIHNTSSRVYEEGNEQSYSDANENSYNTQLSLIYNKKLKHDNNFAAQLYNYHQISMVDYTGDYKYWQHLWNMETLLFVDYSQRFGSKLRIRLHPGLSSLEYKLHGGLYAHQVSPRLNTTLVYQPTANQQIQFNCMIANTYPQIEMINNAKENIDFLQVKRGNPNLNMSTSYDPYVVYTLQIKRLNLLGALFYDFSPHEIVNSYYTDADTLINSYRSDVRYHYLFNLISATYKVNNNLSFKIDSRLKRILYEGPVSTSCTSWNCAFQMNYYYKYFALNFYGKTPEKTVDATLSHSKVPFQYGMSMNRVYKKWQLEFGTDNTFTKHGNYEYRLHSSVYDFDRKEYSSMYNCTAYFKIAYTLDYGKKINKDNKDIDTNIKSTILKMQ